MMQLKQINKAKIIIRYEDNNDKANLGCRKSPNSSMKINYSPDYL